MKDKFLKSTPYKKHQLIPKEEKKCAVCPKLFKGYKHQHYCSEECRAIVRNMGLKKFLEKNPDAMKGYNETRKQKDPDCWKNKWNSEREAIIDKLGGKCCVRGCGVKNIYHLHIDYIPTMAGTGLRHPRHKKWVLDNIERFRLLCANHHYELSLTGKIVGSSITQERKYLKDKK